MAVSNSPDKLFSKLGVFKTVRMAVSTIGIWRGSIEVLSAGASEQLRVLATPNAGKDASQALSDAPSSSEMQACVKAKVDWEAESIWTNGGVHKVRKYDEKEKFSF